MIAPRRWFSAALLACLFARAWGGEAPPSAADPALEARVMQIGSELRCLVCQNQTIAESNAGLAIDLRNQVREQLRAGRSPDEVRDYMVARYGQFVLYRPRWSQTTALLWAGPFALLLLGFVVLGRTIGRRNRLDDDPADSALLRDTR